MFPGACKHLRICTLAPYELAISKLERNIQPDRDDQKHLAHSIPLDLKILSDRARERASLAARKPGTRGINSKTVERHDRRGEKRERGGRPTMKGSFGLFSFASRGKRVIG